MAQRSSLRVLCFENLSWTRCQMCFQSQSPTSRSVPLLELTWAGLAIPSARHPKLLYHRPRFAKEAPVRTWIHWPQTSWLSCLASARRRASCMRSGPQPVSQSRRRVRVARAAVASLSHLLCLPWKAHNLPLPLTPGGELLLMAPTLPWLACWACLASLAWLACLASLAWCLASLACCLASLAWCLTSSACCLAAHPESHQAP